MNKTTPGPEVVLFSSENTSNPLLVRKQIVFVILILKNALNLISMEKNNVIQLFHFLKQFLIFMKKQTYEEFKHKPEIGKQSNR